MTPAEMALIHRSAFHNERPWQASEFAELLDQRFTRAFTAIDGFAITRTLAGESELLTLAVAPSSQRKGIARSLIAEWLVEIGATTETAFLEVAADNAPALALYTHMGFIRTGLRKAYYSRETGPSADAVLMSQALTRG